MWTIGESGGRVYSSLYCSCNFKFEIIIKWQFKKLGQILFEDAEV